jgi:hypothetical protein
MQKFFLYFIRGVFNYSFTKNIATCILSKPNQNEHSLKHYFKPRIFILGGFYDKFTSNDCGPKFNTIFIFICLFYCWVFLIVFLFWQLICIVLSNWSHITVNFIWIAWWLSNWLTCEIFNFGFSSFGNKKSEVK